MVQSKSNSEATQVPILPRRNFSVEFLVGIFTLVGVSAGGWLAVGLGGVTLFDRNHYVLQAEFDNVSGLKKGASVEIAGVPIGSVTGIKLDDPSAIVSMRISNTVQIHDDDIFSIRTKGIIGDRFVRVSRGGSVVVLGPGQTVLETESVVDLEDVISKLIHSFTGEKDNKKKTDEETDKPT